MTGTEIAGLFERLGQLVAATKQKAGDVSAWDYTFANGETHRYVIRGLKSHAEAEDLAHSHIRRVEHRHRFTLVLR